MKRFDQFRIGNIRLEKASNMLAFLVSGWAETSTGRSKQQGALAPKSVRNAWAVTNTGTGLNGGEALDYRRIWKMDGTPACFRKVVAVAPHATRMNTLTSLLVLIGYFQNRYPSF